jgi:hypothetical protein
MPFFLFENVRFKYFGFEKLNLKFLFENIFIENFNSWNYGVIVFNSNILDLVVWT